MVKVSKDTVVGSVDKIFWKQNKAVTCLVIER